MRVVLSLMVCAALSWGTAQTLNADTILSPDAVIANSLGELSAGWVDENLINQTGLSAGFTSGVTDFDAYLAGNPTHTSPSGNPGVGYASPSNNVVSGTIDFDLGGEYSLSRFALWNDTDNQALGNFELRISNDAAFGVSTSLGSFLGATVGNPMPVQTFNLTNGTGRYVRLVIRDTVGGGNNLVNFGEIAFDAKAVPEPSSLALLGLGVVGLVIRRRRRS